MARNVDNALTKRAHIKQQWTEQQIQDMISCMDPEFGYLYFAKNFFHIQHPVKGKLLFDPFEYQLNLLNSYHSYRFNINMLPRQSGKCLTKEINIRIKHKDTGEEYDIPIGDFFEMQRNNSIK